MPKVYVVECVDEDYHSTILGVTFDRGRAINTCRAYAYSEADKPGNIEPGDFSEYYETYKAEAIIQLVYRITSGYWGTWQVTAYEPDEFMNSKEVTLEIETDEELVTEHYGDVGGDMIREKFVTAFNILGEEQEAPQIVAEWYAAHPNFGEVDEQDNIERCLCPRQGQIGHDSCGYCHDCGAPNFCGCGCPNSTGPFNEAMKKEGKVR